MSWGGLGCFFRMLLIVSLPLQGEASLCRELQTPGERARGKTGPRTEGYSLVVSNRNHSLINHIAMFSAPPSLHRTFHWLVQVENMWKVDGSSLVEDQAVSV